MITNPWFGKNKPLMSDKLQAELEAAGYNNMKPLVKYFIGNCTWLITGIEDDILYGFANIGMGVTEWGGLFSLEELGQIHRGPFWLERDLSFKHKEGTNYLEMETLNGI